ATEAVDGVVINHPDGLHEGITDRRADELETALEQVAAERIGFGGLRRQNLEGSSAIHNRRAADKAPEIRVEAPALIAHRQERLRVASGAFDFQTVSYDARILQQPLDVRRPETGDPLRIEVRKRLARAVTL